MTPALARTTSRGHLRRIGALVAAGALALTACTTSSHSSASHQPVHVPPKVGTAKPALPSHIATAAKLAKVAALAKQGVARAYIGLNTSDPDDGIAGNKGDSHYCDGCNPPLVYGPSAPVMNTTGTAGLTITPIYWTPTGKLGMPAHYESIINGYVKNVATASGATSNVYSVSSEYSQTINGVTTPLRYKVTAGTPIVDTGAYPPVAASCRITDPTLKNCVTDGQLQSELTRLKGTNGLTFDLSHIYPIFLAPDVETYQADGVSNSVNVFCGYHGVFTSGTSTAVYGNEPWSNGDGCGSGEDPNGVLSADTAIDVLSHEVSEALTDPTDNRAWNDSVGYEIGDICSGSYGPLLGFTKNPYNAKDQ